MEMGIYVFTIFSYDDMSEQELEELDKAFRQEDTFELHFAYSQYCINDAEFTIASNNPDLICQYLAEHLEDGNKGFDYELIWEE